MDDIIEAELPATHALAQAEGTTSPRL